MSQSEKPKKYARPIHAFYIAQEPNGDEFMVEEPATNIKKAIIATSNIAMAKPTINIIQTAAIVGHYYSSSNSFSSSSSTPSVINSRMSPPLIKSEVDDSLFNDKSSMNRDNANDLPWLAPLLGVLGTLGVVAIAVLYLIGRNKKKKKSKTSVAAAVDGEMKNDYHNNQNSTRSGGKLARSWASFSTINTTTVDEVSEEEKKMMTPSTPPPAYYITPTKQKRLTADTLVDNDSTLMLKGQYSPQLAFSPSLVAGDFQQQQQHRQIMEDISRPPLPSISPSNTLIDHAGILSPSSKEGFYSYDPSKKKIEMYEPHVNLRDPFFIPDSYSNEKEEEDEEKHHHIVNMNNAPTIN